jgi:hypothetical protein
MLRGLVRPLAKRLIPNGARSLSSSPEFGLYPGDVKVPFVSELKILTRDDYETIPAYRVLDNDGTIRADADPDVEVEYLPVRHFE